MIVYKEWLGRKDHRGYQMRYEGWFLFGLVPLYLVQQGWVSR